MFLWFLHFIDYYNEQQLWDYMISGFVLHSTIWYFVPAFAYCYYYTDDHYQQLWLYWGSSIAILPMMELFLSTSRRWYDVYVGNQWNFKSVRMVLCTSEFLLAALLGWCYINEDDLQRCFWLRSPSISLFNFGLYIADFGCWYGLI